MDAGKKYKTCKIYMSKIPRRTPSTTICLKFICIHSHTHPSIRKNPWPRGPLWIQFYDFVLWCEIPDRHKMSQDESSETRGKNCTGWERWSDSSYGLGPTKDAFCSPDSLRTSPLLISMHHSLFAVLMKCIFYLHNGVHRFFPSLSAVLYWIDSFWFHCWLVISKRMAWDFCYSALHGCSIVERNL